MTSKARNPSFNSLPFLNKNLKRIDKAILQSLPPKNLSKISKAIHYSVLNENGLISKIASNYKSNYDLIHFCMGSSSIPYITIPSFCYKYKYEWSQGGLNR